MAGAKLRVLVVDDSLLYRMAIREALVRIDGVEVVDSANDGRQALEKILTLDPDLLTLDVQMPGLDGLGVLREMKQRGDRAKAIMVSSLTGAGAKATTDALLEGAFDFILKPSGTDQKQNLGELRSALRAKIGAFLQTRSPVQRLSDSARRRPSPKDRSRGDYRIEVVVIGTSTGGPEALRSVLPKLPADFPAAVLVVQHMPAQYTAALAARLDEMSPLRVEEAAEGSELTAGKVLIAPGGRQMKVVKKSGRSIVSIKDDPPEHGCRPSIDYLLRSAAEVFGGSALAAILTGMGKDGTAGCREIKQLGGLVLAQDQETSTVFGMPRSVIEAGLTDAVVPLDETATEIRSYFG